ncbi:MULTISPECIES: CBS domain-containing protein [Acinetobacter]|uniref:CBS domain-containing protein n=1 Tax=Acinetobacter kyonggiensis TaxID=595670 RepID=A0A1H3N712_9GAMM|nr:MULTISPECIES: CBS domain-containing protein [Acinetobacter]OTG96087.1 histidine kinase [Acinetobacter sp. ANC 4973]SDY84608.1 CBS domain-containing protein [Acinetobacter kyonggiensis]
MTNVAQVIQNKIEQNIFTISPESTVLEAISLMADKGIGALVVTDQDKVVGILSERDYTRKVILMERTSKETTVSEIMTAKVLTVTKSNSVEDCLDLMTDRHLRHLPVVENDKLIGLISIGDLVKVVMEDQRKLIDQLQQYIAS